MFSCTPCAYLSTVNIGIDDKGIFSASFTNVKPAQNPQLVPSQPWSGISIDGDQGQRYILAQCFGAWKSYSSNGPDVPTHKFPMTGNEQLEYKTPVFTASGDIVLGSGAICRVRRTLLSDLECSRQWHNDSLQDAKDKIIAPISSSGKPRL